MQDFQKVLPQQMIQDYFKFSFIRNPWDKVVSNYFDQTSSIGFGYRDMSFEDFVIKIKETQHIHVLPQYKFITDRDGKINVDFIGRYENLKEDLKRIESKIGCSFSNLRHIHKSERKHYSKYYGHL